MTKNKSTSPRNHPIYLHAIKYTDIWLVQEIFLDLLDGGEALLELADEWLELIKILQDDLSLLMRQIGI